MFNLLRKKLSRSVKKVSEKVSERKLSGRDIDGFWSEVEIDLLESNVALEVTEFLKESLKSGLAGKQVKRRSAKGVVERVFRDSIIRVLDQGSVDIVKLVKKAKSENRPAVLVFLGFNGVGKSMTIYKLASMLKKKGFKPVLAAADTFRAASIEQLNKYGESLGLKVIKHDYGADPAAVVYDAVKHAQASGSEVMLADTAGRSHANVNLMDELKKICRVNPADLKILVLDSLSGNDVVSQAEKFNEAVGVDAMVLTKLDVNPKGGAVLSACHALRKPVLFLGTGQKPEDLVKFSPEKIANSLLAT